MTIDNISIGGNYGGSGVSACADSRQSPWSISTHNTFNTFSTIHANSAITPGPRSRGNSIMQSNASAGTSTPSTQSITTLQHTTPFTSSHKHHLHITPASHTGTSTSSTAFKFPSLPPIYAGTLQRTSSGNSTNNLIKSIAAIREDCDLGGENQDDNEEVINVGVFS